MSNAPIVRQGNKTTINIDNAMNQGVNMSSDIEISSSCKISSKTRIELIINSSIGNVLSLTNPDTNTHELTIPYMLNQMGVSLESVYSKIKPLLSEAQDKAIKSLI